MNYIDEIFNRCSIEKIGNFLLHGTELVHDNTQSYYSRSKNVYKELNEWLETQFPSYKDQDEQGKSLFSFTCEIENIYFQLGLQCGIMLFADFNKKHKDQK